MHNVFEIAYRNLIFNPGPPVADGVGVAHLKRSRRRETQRVAADSLVADLLERTGAIRSQSFRLARNNGGKPFLVSEAGRSAIKVSLSHSGCLVMAGITDLGEIGIDLEHLGSKRSIGEIAAFAFGPGEQRAVKAGGPRAFYRIWTLREAMGKARGLGFDLITDGRDYFPEVPNSSSWRATIDGSSWLFATVELSDDGYMASVAVALPCNHTSSRVTDVTVREIT
jgi:4'-phosphopantetheinyl transferase